MSYYVIIRGPLGVGKSTIAKKLAKLLAADYVSIDKLLEKYGLDKVPEGAECIPLSNFIKAQEKILQQIKRKLAEGQKIVFDGNFYHKGQIEHLTQNLDMQHFAFTLKAPLQVCIERDNKRAKPYGKDATRAVYSLVSKFDYGIVVDTNKKSEERVVADILSYLSRLVLKN